MEAWWLGVLGCAVLAVVTLDQLSTILGTGEGHGVVTPRLHRLIWRVLCLVRCGSSGRRTPVAWIGPTLLLVGPALWIVGLWAGWTLIFAADPDAVLSSQTAQPVPTGSRAYFAGFSVSTLGVGDVVPGPGWWQPAAVLASLMGLTMITLSITYLVPVVRAATSRRRTARSICAALSLADHGDEAVAAGLDRLADTFDEVAEQHRTYHVLRYFTATSPDASLPTQVERALASLTTTPRAEGQGDPGARWRALASLMGLAAAIIDGDPDPNGLVDALRAFGGR